MEEAVNAVVRGKNITEQAEVDAMAKVIEDAIAALERNLPSPLPTATAKPVTVSAQAEAVKETAAVVLSSRKREIIGTKSAYQPVCPQRFLRGTAVLKNRKPHK
ncbi:MAG: hypothetical protein ACLUFT_10275 [Gemmiger formicilis]|uniref:hypothetical protein n=1 Tax=Gemmiger formicilis TaxID=745368 RepID=UPI003991DCF2